VLASLLPLAAAQINPQAVTLEPPRPIAAKRGETVRFELGVQLRNGYHMNSNTPADEYLIPLRLTWDDGPLQVVDIVYPKPKMEKYEFSEKPLSVYTGDFKITTQFKAKPDAPPAGTMTGKLRYQACTEKACLPPKTIPVSVPVTVAQ
jgi:thiol:disulfide interchange protein DsbD